MEPHLRAGIAVYNAGEYHAAHDAWEDQWLSLESGTDDEQFLHGLIQFTASVYHAHDANWSGATGLARSAGEYLGHLPAQYRGVDVEAAREYLRVIETDPETVERSRPQRLSYDGRVLGTTDLDLPATIVAAAVLAEEYGFEESVVEQAGRYATTDIEEGTTASPFVTLLFDFVREPENRPIVMQRLSEHVSRRERREADVTGLFDTEE